MEDSSPSSSAAAAGTAAASDMDAANAMVIAAALEEFFGANRQNPKLQCQSTRTLIKIISNAAERGDTDAKFRRIRFSNAKIQELVVQPAGALDVLGLAGFHISSGDGKGEERFIVFDPTAENIAVGRQIIHQLEARLIEFEFQHGGGSTASAAALGGNSGAAAATTTTRAGAATSAAPDGAGADDDDKTGPFLSQEERKKRQAEAKKKRKEKEAAKKLALLRWSEDKEERGLVEARKTAAKQVAVREGRGDFATRDAISIKRMNNSSGGADEQRQQSSAMEGRPDKPLHPLAGGDAAAMKKQPPTTAAAASSPSHSEAPFRLPAPLSPVVAFREEQVQKSQKADDAETDAAIAAAIVAADVDVPMDTDQEGGADDARKPAPVVDDGMDTATAADPAGGASEAARQEEWKKHLDNIPLCAPAENIRETSCYNKKHQAGASMTSSSPACLKTLLRELDTLKETLPVDSRCSVWIRFDEETPQYLRAVITAALPGPTPYNGGLFAFDIYVPGDYPAVPPKVTLLTTGGGRVRFGPNLYNCGKVCLSLLGTWPGERWNPRLSNLHQVLLSIQGLILGAEHPYFLEPGHGGWEGTVKDGDFAMMVGHTLSGEVAYAESKLPPEAAVYEDGIRNATVRYAMIDMIQSTRSCGKKAAKATMTASGLLESYGYLEAFEQPILAHFYHNRDAVLKAVRPWLKGRSFSNSDSKRTLKALEKLYARLQAELGALGDAASGAFATPAAAAETKEAPPAAALPLAGNVKPPLPTAAKSEVAVAAKDSSAMDVDEEQGVKDQAKEEDPMDRIRGMMQKAAAASDFVLAGKLQEQIKKLEELQGGMKEAAAQCDFIRAGKLQEQFKARVAAAVDDLPNEERKKNRRMQDFMGGAAAKSYNQHHMMGGDDDYFDEEEEDFDDYNDGMDGGPMSFPPPSFPPQSHFQAPPPPAGMGGLFGGMKLGQKKQKVAQKHNWGGHKWGGGRTLVADDDSPAIVPNSPTAQASPAAQPPEDTHAAKMKDPPAPPPPKHPRSGIACHLRVRLQGAQKSITEDFDAMDTLAEVYRRLESYVEPPPSQDQASMTGISPVARRTQVMTPYGASMVAPTAFENPLSLNGFTLLLAHPKREFSLEMHGTKTLQELGLVPSAMLTVMMCSERGVVRRGDLEDRLSGAQGDAMDVEGLSYESMLELTERVGAELEWTPQDQADLERNSFLLSPVDYLASLKQRAATDGDVDDDRNDTSCPICLGAFDPEDTSPSLRRLKACGHVFHVACLSTWLRTKRSCPMCKEPINGGDGDAKAAAKSAPQES